MSVLYFSSSARDALVKPSVWLYDLIHAAQTRTLASHVVVVDIDDDLVSEFGQWPWPRSRHAQIINRIAAYQPEVIAYNVLFAERSQAFEDETLRSAMARAKRLVLPVVVHSSNQNSPRLTTPHPLFLNNNTELGFSNFFTQSDGVIRTLQSGVDVATKTIPHFALVMSGLTSQASVSSWRLPYFLQPEFRTLPASRLLGEEGFLDLFKGKTVIVGLSSESVSPYYKIPGRWQVAGRHTNYISSLALQAASFEYAKQSLWLQEMSEVLGLALSMFLLAILLGICWRSQDCSWVKLLIMIIVSLSVSFVLMHYQMLWYDPLSVIICMLIFSWVLRYLQLRKLFSVLEHATGHLMQTLPYMGIVKDLNAENVKRLKKPLALSTRVNRSIQDFSNLQALAYKSQSLLLETLNKMPEPVALVEHSGQLRYRNDAFMNTMKSLSITSCSMVFDDWMKNLLAAFKPNSQSSWFDKPWNCLVEPMSSGESFTTLLENTGVFLELKLSQLPLHFAKSDEQLYLILLHDVTSKEQGIRAKEEMVQWLAHDMRAPLVSVSYLVAQLQQTEQMPDDQALPLQQKLFGEIKKVVTRTLHLADQFLHLKKVESQLVLDNSENNLPDVIQNALDQISPSAREKSIRIHFDTCEDFIWVSIDPAVVERAFVNVLSNAVRYSPDNSQITVGCQVKSGQVEVFVQDQGPGCDEQLLASVFQNGASDGLSVNQFGLGLRFVYLAFEKHYGSVCIKNVRKPQVGCCVTMGIPYNPRL